MGFGDYETTDDRTTGEEQKVESSEMGRWKPEDRRTEDGRGKS
jgi:hypothetical protein